MRECPFFLQPDWGITKTTAGGDPILIQTVRSRQTTTKSFFWVPVTATSENPASMLREQDTRTHGYWCAKAPLRRRLWIRGAHFGLVAFDAYLQPDNLIFVPLCGEADMYAYAWQKRCASLCRVVMCKFDNIYLCRNNTMWLFRTVHTKTKNMQLCSLRITRMEHYLWMFT